MLCTEEKALEAAEIVSAGMIAKALSTYTLTFINEMEKATRKAEPLPDPHDRLVLNIVKKALALAMIDLTAFCTAVIEETDLT